MHPDQYSTGERNTSAIALAVHKQTGATGNLVTRFMRSYRTGAPRTAT